MCIGLHGMYIPFMESQSYTRRVICRIALVYKLRFTTLLSLRLWGLSVVVLIYLPKTKRVQNCWVGFRVKLRVTRWATHRRVAKLDDFSQILWSCGAQVRVRVWVRVRVRISVEVSVSQCIGLGWVWSYVFPLMLEIRHSTRRSLKLKGRVAAIVVCRGAPIIGR